MLDHQNSNTVKSTNAFADFYRQLVDDTSFLWILRSVAMEQPHYTLSDISSLEERISTNLNGIMSSLEHGWKACESALELEEPGEVFTSMVIAMRSHEPEKIQRAVEAGLSNEHALPGLLSAMGWLPADIVSPWIERFLKGKEMEHKYLGVAICSIRRIDPGNVLTNILERDDCRQNERLYCRALRLVGELHRQDCMSALSKALDIDNPEIQFWATWSSVLLGHRAVITHFLPIISTPGPHQSKAIQMAFRVLPVNLAREWISTLSEDESQYRTVIKAVSTLGDPHAIDWLISKMHDPLLAKLAGEAFVTITGIDFTKHHLTIDETETTEETTEVNSEDHEDSPEISSNAEEDQNLPLPNVEKVAIIWRNHGQNYITGQRYFMGKPITAEHLKNIILTGNQRQRHSAALELALIDNNTLLQNTREKSLSS